MHPAHDEQAPPAPTHSRDMGLETCVPTHGIRFWEAFECGPRHALPPPVLEK